MNRWNIPFLCADYLRIRHQQLGRDPQEQEIRGINGFAEYLINLMALEESLPHHDPRGP